MKIKKMSNKQFFVSTLAGLLMLPVAIPITISHRLFFALSSIFEILGVWLQKFDYAMGDFYSKLCKSEKLK